MTRFLVFMLAVVVVVLVCLKIGGVFTPSGQAVTAAAPESPGAVETILATAPSPVLPPSMPVFDIEPDCAGPTAMITPAALNAASVGQLGWSPFGRPETGWETYWPKIADEIHTDCPPSSPGFAEALARWQSDHRLKGDGIMVPAVFEAMKNAWHGRRPYVSVRGRGICPDPPPEETLAVALPSESYGGKTLRLRPAALSAYRRMIEAARRDEPGLFNEHRDMLKIYSAYRSPAYDAERCAREGNCQGITRAECSPHRTGLAMDIVVGQAPGYGVDSSADPNRLFMSRTRAYHWLVANAQRFGFVNYVFEPWHWEWVGEPA